MQVLALLCREREGTAPSGRGRIAPADPSALDVFERDLVDLDAPVGAAGSAGPAPSGPTLLVCPMSVVGACSAKPRSSLPTWRCTSTTAATGCAMSPSPPAPPISTW